MIFGYLRSGHYVQVGMGMGFYLPEAAFSAAQDAANITGKVQFLGVTVNGQSLRGSRDEVLGHPASAGVCAWVIPQTNKEGTEKQ